MLYLHFETLKGMPNSPIPKLRHDVVRFIFSAEEMELDTNFTAFEYQAITSFVEYTKQIPASNRSFNPQTNIWTLNGANFEGMRQIAINFPEFKNTILLRSWNCLPDFIARLDPQQVAYFTIKNAAKNWGENHNKPPQPIADEDFFYNSSQPITQSVAKATVEQTLCLLFEVSTLPAAKDELLKCYRRAAMKYHPDRNAGDGSKMSELNAAWQQFKS